MQYISKFKCPYITKEQIWLGAENFRSEYWPEDTYPVNMEMIIENRLRLNIEPEHDLMGDLDIDAWLRVDLTGIIVDYNCDMNEKYF